MKIWAKIADTINHRKCPDSQIVFFSGFQAFKSQVYKFSLIKAESIPFSLFRETRKGERVQKPKKRNKL